MVGIAREPPLPRRIPRTNPGTVYESNNPRDNGRRIVIVHNDPRSPYVVARSADRGIHSNIRKDSFRDQPPFVKHCYRKVQRNVNADPTLLQKISG